jgi:CelD/BcsL family acetyltransferase involved in cellulose biosynthesis
LREREADRRTEVRSGRVGLFDNLVSLDALREAWEALEPSARGPMEQFAWSRTCAWELPGAGGVQVHTVWDGGRCRAIAPLALRPGWLGRLESIGVKELAEPMNFLYASRAALAQLCEALARQGRPIELGRVRADGRLIEALRRAYRGRAWVRIRRVDPYPSLKIDGSWMDPESHFNAGRRSDFRRALRRAEQLGPTQFEVLTPERANLEPLLAQAYAVEMQGWKGRNGTALAIDPACADFFRRYFAACCDKGILRVAFMRIGGKAVGMQLAVEVQHRLWLIKIGHDEAYSRCSPGTLLMLHVARYAAQQGLRSIEFLGREEPWTQVWTTRVRDCDRIRIYPYTLAGLIALGVDTWRWLAHRVRRAAPAQGEKAQGEKAQGETAHA